MKRGLLGEGPDLLSLGLLGDLLELGLVLLNLLLEKHLVGLDLLQLLLHVNQVVLVVILLRLAVVLLVAHSPLRVAARQLLGVVVSDELR